MSLRPAGRGPGFPSRLGPSLPYNCMQRPQLLGLLFLQNSKAVSPLKRPLENDSACREGRKWRVGGGAERSGPWGRQNQTPPALASRVWG